MIRSGPVLVDFLRRVLYPVPPLNTIPPAEMHEAAADHAVAADIDILVDENDRGAVLKRRDGRRKPGYARYYPLTSGCFRPKAGIR